MRWNILIVLGGQCGLKDGRMGLAPHTEMRARAAGIAVRKKFTPKLILCGGYNFGVRYDLNMDIPVFGTPKSDRKPDFSPEAKEMARQWRSEASLMAEFVRRVYGVAQEQIIMEEDSSTTTQNAHFSTRIVERMTRPSVLEKMLRFLGIGRPRIGLLTQLYHMNRALAEFRGQSATAGIMPVFAEELLVLEDQSWIDNICQYYDTPRGEVQYKSEWIRHLLVSGQSLEELMV